MDSSASGDGQSSASSAVKRGLSVDSGQEVKRFRTATGAISAVRKTQILFMYSEIITCDLVYCCFST